MTTRQGAQRSRRIGCAACAAGRWVLACRQATEGWLDCGVDEADGQARLLRGVGRNAGSLDRRDPQGVSRGGAQAPSRSKPGRLQGRGALQGDQRSVPGAVGRLQEAHLRPVRARGAGESWQRRLVDGLQRHRRRLLAHAANLQRHVRQHAPEPIRPRACPRARSRPEGRLRADVPRVDLRMQAHGDREVGRHVPGVQRHLLQARNEAGGLYRLQRHGRSDGAARVRDVHQPVRRVQRRRAGRDASVLQVPWAGCRGAGA